jgi:hypothetical protein
MSTQKKQREEKVRDLVDAVVDAVDFLSRLWEE